MSKLLLFCTVTCLFALCWSKSIILEDKPGYCTSLGIYIKENEDSPAPLGSCHLITCDRAQPQTISTITCPPFLPAPGCAIGEYDYTKLYPACCPTAVC